jgi:hypothetical protein
MRAGRFKEAIRYLSREELRGTRTAQRLLLLAYRQQGRRDEADKLEQQLLAPSLPEQATGLLGQGAGPLGGLRALSPLMEVAASKRRLHLEWSDWRDLLPANEAEEMKVSAR